MTRTITAPVGTKSDRFRTILRNDPDATITSAAEAVGIGYAFAYGIAKRTADPANPGNSYAATRANRRATKSVSVADGFVSIRIVGPDGEYRGTVRVELATGKTTRGR